MTTKQTSPLPPSPYGGWESPLSAADLARGVVGLHEPRVLGDELFWLESRPAESGRSVLLKRSADGNVRELTPAPFNVRSRVHEYGGGAYLPTPAGVFFVNFTDQRLYQIDGNAIDQITHNDPTVRIADLAWDAYRQRLIAITETHGEGSEASNALQAIDPQTGDFSPLHGSHDFYAAPRVSPDGGQLAFLHWDHPNMPWDGSQLSMLNIDGHGRPVAETIIAGGASESVLQPEWLADGLLFLSDRNGFWNLYRYDASGVFCVLEDGVDYGSPPWVFAMRHYAALDERYVAVARQGAEPQLVLVDSVAGFATPLDIPDRVAGFGDLVKYADGICCLTQYTHGLPARVHYEPKTGKLTRLRESGKAPLAEDYIAPAEHMQFPTRDGAHAYAYVYWPKNPLVAKPEGELPPLLVLTHGGPTGAASSALNLRAQYYTTRGWAVADVNYRGSSGYGRAYRDALKGGWGLIDVADCEDLAQHLIATQRVDAARIAIRGGSAGGFTTLAALTTTQTFRAGASHYGIGDLRALAEDTHKFESRYLDSLLGDEDALANRSPIHHIDALNCPVIFFQGSDDKVVPPNQSQAMVKALRNKAIPVAYLEFPHEGHGFRRAENIIRAMESEYAFFCRVFAIAAEDAIELEIENL
jgi:dipeptidyl aminopeptidase/acylaminoacyl peptidase